MKKEPKINIFDHFSSRSLLMKFPNKILLGYNMTHLLKKICLSKWRRITLSKASNFSFLYYPCTSLFVFFDADFSMSKSTDFNLSKNV